jgi:phospholipid/cholesterol/gamma-HCH transport system permease protein
MRVVVLDGIKVLGAICLDVLENIGGLFSFFGQSLLNVFAPPFYASMLLRSMLDIGFRSVPVVAVSSFFMGSVFVMQTYIGLSRFNAESALAEASVVSITRELGPLLVGLVLSGRVGASIAAEISTMRVTEQIDALVTLTTSPIKYLVVPRLLAAVLLFPALGAIADIVGVYGGYLVSVYKLYSNPHFYITNTVASLTSYDVITGLVKTSFFGAIIAMVACYYGLNANRGARGVGTSVTGAVITSSVLVLLCNYVLTSLFFSAGAYV